MESGKNWLYFAKKEAGSYPSLKRYLCTDGGETAACGVESDLFPLLVEDELRHHASRDFARSEADEIILGVEADIFSLRVFFSALDSSCTRSCVHAFQLFEIERSLARIFQLVQKFFELHGFEFLHPVRKLFFLRRALAARGQRVVSSCAWLIHQSALFHRSLELRLERAPASTQSQLGFCGRDGDVSYRILLIAHERMDSAGAHHRYARERALVAESIAHCACTARRLDDDWRRKISSARVVVATFAVVEKSRDRRFGRMIRKHEDVLHAQEVVLQGFTKAVAPAEDQLEVWEPGPGRAGRSSCERVRLCDGRVPRECHGAPLLSPFGDT